MDDFLSLHLSLEVQFVVVRQKAPNDNLAFVVPVACYCRMIDRCGVRETLSLHNDLKVAFKVLVSDSDAKTVTKRELIVSPLHSTNLVLLIVIITVF